MRIGDTLLFSPSKKFEDLNWDDGKDLIKAFQERVMEFYFTPAEELNRNRSAFATGVLCATTIDFLARITIWSDKVGERIERWLRIYITDFNQLDNQNKTLARRFYEDFRNGLVHEGRIKKCGQFSYGYEIELIHVDDGIMIINPDLLLENTKRAFNSYIADIEKDDSKFQQFRCALRRDFQEDVEYAKRLKS